VTAVNRNHLLRSLAASGLALFALLFVAGAASAQSDDYTEQPTSSVAPASSVAPSTPATRAASASKSVTEAPAVPVRDTPLAVTGSDVITLGLVGAGLIAIGGVALVARRRVAAVSP